MVEEKEVEYLDSDGNQLKEGAFYHLKTAIPPVYFYRFKKIVREPGLDFGAHFDRAQRPLSTILSYLDTRFYKKAEDSLAVLCSTQDRITAEIAWVKSQLEEDAKKSTQRAINEMIYELIE
ncbi:hypothetical protein CMI46_00515 [Candidatus Pacearchaeota archaeon]|nr:hypothetical protein [Candidatus Pacearchaeota archaeon]|tara:strand:- start:5015 stop:5377 length:363 start_codon:yes stop_codon:yes gene_type:complete